MNWFVLALLASVLWGFNYASYGAKLTSIPATSMLTYYYGGMLALFAMFSKVRGETLFVPLTRSQSLWMVVNIVTGALAVYFTTRSMQQKNATLVSLIEIAYPVFVALFSIFLFQQGQITWKITVGGILIMAGISLISTS